MTCHPDPALREKDLLFFAPRDEVGCQCYRSELWSFARIVVAHGLGAGREDSRCFSVKSNAKEGLADVPVIEKGTTVTDFRFRSGPTAFNTSALNPEVVSDNFPLVYRTPWRSTFRSSKL